MMSTGVKRPPGGAPPEAPDEVTRLRAWIAELRRERDYSIASLAILQEIPASPT